MKLALGTVQFGLNYGINNKTGQVSADSVKSIFEYAYQNNIEFLDTAQAYGSSEDIIGESIGKTGLKFNIIDKISPENVLLIPKSFEKSLEKLRHNNIYGLLFHDFNSFRENLQSFSYLEDLKNKGYVKKIGFSLYYPEQLNFLFENNFQFDLIQIPYSIFDRRFENMFAELKRRNIEIHVRSVFLQGLVFIKPEELKSYFKKVYQKIFLLNKISTENNVSISSICLNFALMNEQIDKVVIGIDNLENLKENLNKINDLSKIESLMIDLEELKEDDENILLPFNWKE